VIASSNPFKVKLANVGLIIPSWGVPEGLSENLVRCMLPALSHEISIGLSVISKGILAISQGCDMLSKNPLISASNTYLSYS